MGYTTDFFPVGRGFMLDRLMEVRHANYLGRFNEIRHMKRDEKTLRAYIDPIREAVGLPIGHEGEYFTGDGTRLGSLFKSECEDAYDNESILNANEPPYSQPGLWCQWTVGGPVDGKYTTIEWDRREKFYHYVEWLEYIIKNFLVPWGYTLNGKVRWQGEDKADKGVITVKDNKVTIR
jgi:hypothetical protein